VEQEETLETGALVSQLTDAIKHQVDQLLADGVVTSGVVVGGILLASDQLLGVEQLAVGTSTNLVYNSWLKIDKHSPWNMFAGSSLTEEGVEGIVSASDGLVTGHLTVRLDAVFQAVQLPAGIADLDTSLADVDTDALTHVDRFGLK